MSDELLPYYNRELAFIRRMGAEFAEANPKIAGRLRLQGETSEDPHVERLIEAFAYLNARTRHKLDDDFPEITDAMLGVLYPHYQNPIPSMAITQFVLDRGQGDLTGGYQIPTGAALETDPVGGVPCRFQTCYPTTLWPFELLSTEMVSRPFSAPSTRWTSSAAAVVRLELACYAKKTTFSQLSLDSLRFFLHGQGQHVYKLYEMLLNDALGVALAASPKDEQPALLDADCIRPVGFERDEGMFPYAARSFLGYRLLSEFFTFPQKFLFVDLAGLGRGALAKAGNRLEIYIYLKQTSEDLERNVATGTFRAGCAPVVNLYKHRADPIRLTHRQSEYRVVPDARRPLAAEIYSIASVTATSPDNEEVDYAPFFSFKHAADHNRQKAFWSATRRRVPTDDGTEVYLSLVDMGFDPSVSAGWTLDVETICLDRDLPHRLPFGDGQPVLRLSKGGPVSRVQCLTRPTPTLRPALKKEALWRLISHLSLNHLSLADFEEGADALREILKLYDFADSAETRGMIDGVTGINSRRSVGRVPGGGEVGFCRGVEVTVNFDETRFTGCGVYLFASVLERFLGLYCSINSFSKLIATTNKREGVLCRWSPRAGETLLL